MNRSRYRRNVHALVTVNDVTIMVVNFSMLVVVLLVDDDNIDDDDNDNDDDNDINNIDGNSDALVICVSIIRFLLKLISGCKKQTSDLNLIDLYCQEKSLVCVSRDDDGHVTFRMKKM